MKLALCWKWKIKLFQSLTPYNGKEHLEPQLATMWYAKVAGKFMLTFTVIQGHQQCCYLILNMSRSGTLSTTCLACTTVDRSKQSYSLVRWQKLQLMQVFSALTLLAGRQERHPTSKKFSGGMLAWLCVWLKVQICIWHSWCHCHSLSLASVNPDWFYLSGTGSPG